MTMNLIYPPVLEEVTTQIPIDDSDNIKTIVGTTPKTILRENETRNGVTVLNAGPSHLALQLGSVEANASNPVSKDNFYKMVPPGVEVCISELVRGALNAVFMSGEGTVYVVETGDSTQGYVPLRDQNTEADSAEP